MMAAMVWKLGYVETFARHHRETFVKPSLSILVVLLLEFAYTDLSVNTHVPILRYAYVDMDVDMDSSVCVTSLKFCSGDHLLEVSCG